MPRDTACLLKRMPVLTPVHLLSETVRTVRMDVGLLCQAKIEAAAKQQGS